LRRLWSALIAGLTLGIVETLGASFAAPAAADIQKSALSQR
jgi:hypothetical protein